MQFLIIALAFGCLPCLNAQGAAKLDDLVSVIVVYRHGDRTPVDPYPTDPYNNLSYWPVGWGQLTNLGKQQHYELGKWLRNRYDGFLPKSYSEEDIYVRSTDVDRTLMSADVNLAGLYEPVGKQVWNPALDWQPIPVHTRPEREDFVLAMKRPCTKYTHLLKELMATPEFVNIQHKNHDLYAYLTRSTGRTISNIESLEFVFNTLLIEELYNYTLPAWTNKVYPDKMRPWAYLSFAVACYTPDLARLKTGPLFYEFLDHLHNVSHPELNHVSRKMKVYSAHDTTIANILNTMNVFEYHGPPYASAVLIELHNTSNRYYVNIIYKNDTVPLQLRIPGCTFDCPLEKFMKLLEPIAISPKKWLDECEDTAVTFTSFTTIENLVIVACFMLFLMLVTSIIVGFVCSKPKSEKRSYLRLPDSDEAA